MADYKLFHEAEDDAVKWLESSATTASAKWNDIRVTSERLDLESSFDKYLQILLAKFAYQGQWVKVMVTGGKLVHPCVLFRLKILHALTRNIHIYYAGTSSEYLGRVLISRSLGRAKGQWGKKCLCDLFAPEQFVTQIMCTQTQVKDHEPPNLCIKVTRLCDWREQQQCNPSTF